MPTHALDDSMPYFRLIDGCPNPNITVRILRYANSWDQVPLILLLLCKKSRSFVLTQRGVIEYEAKPVYRLRKSDHIMESPPVHDQVYPLPADINYNRFIVGVKECAMSG